MLNTLIFFSFMCIGFALMLWARITLVAHSFKADKDSGWIDWPCKLTGPAIVSGPYRFVSHPSYIGTMFFVAGLAGLAAGWWNVAAVVTVCELLLREWAWRERGHFEGWHR